MTLEQIISMLENDGFLPTERLVWCWVALAPNQRRDLGRALLEAPCDKPLDVVNVLFTKKALTLEGRVLVALSVEAAKKEPLPKLPPAPTSVPTPTPNTPTPFFKPAPKGPLKTTVRLAPELKAASNMFERLVIALERPRLTGARFVTDEALGQLFGQINKTRKKHGYKTRSFDAKKLRTKGRKLLKFLIENGVTMQEFMEFAFQRTRWQGDHFPAENMIFGPWLQGQFLDREESSSHGPSHAGSRYVSEGRENVLEASLQEADLWVEGWDEAMMRHLVSGAEMRLQMPHMAEEDDDPSVERAIAWMTSQGPSCWGGGS